jgi:hypothetical protein
MGLAVGNKVPLSPASGGMTQANGLVDISLRSVLSILWCPLDTRGFTNYVSGVLQRDFPQAEEVRLGRNSTCCSVRGDLKIGYGSSLDWRRLVVTHVMKSTPPRSLRTCPRGLLPDLSLVIRADGRVFGFTSR